MLLCRADRPIPESERRKIAPVLQRPLRGGDPGARCRHDLRGADQLSRAGPRRRGAAATSGSHAPAPDLDRWRDIVARVDPPGGRGDDRRGRQVHRPARRLQVAGRGADPRRHRQQRPRQRRLDRLRRSSRTAATRAAAGGRARHPGAGRLRRARRAGQDRGGALRPRARRAVLRHLLRHADGGGRGGAQPRRHSRRRLDRVRPVRGAGGRPDDRMDARQPTSSSARRAATSAAPCGSAPTSAC